MKAIVRVDYGPPERLQLLDVAQPVPTGDQVLVRVHAASVNALDWRPFTLPTVLLRLTDGFKAAGRRTILGADLAGRVEAVGPLVQRFRPGDEVFGAGRGSFAQHACVAQDRLASMPANLSFEEAAAVPVAALTALQALRDRGKVRAGQRVLIHGAGGGVGSFAVQIAKGLGAQVTAVCGPGSVEMVRRVGADRVIDYVQEDVTRGGERFDVIAGVNGSHSVLTYRRMLAPHGIFVGLGGSLAPLLAGLLAGPVLSRLGDRKVGAMAARVNGDDLSTLREMLESARIVPVIVRRYPLAEAQAAIKYLLQGHAAGKVVITMDR